MAKTFTLHDVDLDRARMLRAEVQKVRCWLTGFVAGRSGPNGHPIGIPGEEGLRQMQIIFDESIAKATTIKK